MPLIRKPLQFAVLQLFVAACCPAMVVAESGPSLSSLATTAEAVPQRQDATAPPALPSALMPGTSRNSAKGRASRRHLRRGDTLIDSTKRVTTTAMFPEQPIIKTIAALAVALAALVAVALLLRRVSPRSKRSLSTEVLEPLGSTLLGPKRPVQLVRLGTRLLLLSVAEDQVRTLAIIDDPDEVARLTAAASRGTSNSVDAGFQAALAEYAPPAKEADSMATNHDSGLHVPGGYVARAYR